MEILRRQAAHSQAQLVRLSTVSIRSIQMYEQRQNNTRKALYNVQKALAGVLGCEVEELVCDGLFILAATNPQYREFRSLHNYILDVWLEQ